jgi:hypothetical protein
MTTIAAPPVIVLNLGADAEVETQRRPWPATVAGTPGDHPPALDLAVRGTRLRLAADPTMTADQVRELRRVLIAEGRALLADLAQYEADVLAREASA